MMALLWAHIEASFDELAPLRHRYRPRHFTPEVATTSPAYIGRHRA